MPGERNQCAAALRTFCAVCGVHKLPCCHNRQAAIRKQSQTQHHPDKHCVVPELGVAYPDVRAALPSLRACIWASWVGTGSLPASPSVPRRCMQAAMAHHSPRPTVRAASNLARCCESFGAFCIPHAALVSSAHMHTFCGG